MKGKGIKIVATGRALPERQITNDDLSRMVETSDEWITTRTGIRSRFWCEEESSVSLAVKAAKEAIRNAGILPEEIGAVLAATSTPDYAFPSIAALVQKECHLPEEMTAFDINAACTGFLMGLTVAEGLLTAMEKKYVLLIGSEELSRIVDQTDRSTCILFGDGAGAAILTSGEGTFVQKSWTRGNEEVLNCYGVGKANAYIHMNGQEVFRFAVNALEQAIEEVLAEANMTMDEIDLVICHQANERIIRHVQKKYKEQKEKFFLNISKYGNTSAASIPIALDECREEGRLQPGMKILCVGFGAGLTWSGALLEI